MWDKRISSLKCSLVCFLLSVLKPISFVFKWNRVVSMHLCPWNHMEGHWRSVFFLEKYFPSLSPLPFFNLQNLRNVLFTMNYFVGKFDKCFNVANNLHVWRPVSNRAKAPITMPIQKQTTVEPRLSGPRLFGLFLWSQFGHEYLFVTIKIGSYILFKTTALKSAVKWRGFCFQRAQAM